LHGANDQKVLAGGDRESVGAGFTDSGIGPYHQTTKRSASFFRVPSWKLKVLDCLRETVTKAHSM
ncbi:hypothetical protein, partial [Halomonas sp. 141]|uniref:hypothetical protein n=1 Tax=Halomonas sp. 141 TaxID=2056666 RepID=UPI001E5EC52B